MVSSCLSLFLQGEIFITQAKRKQTSLCLDCQGAHTVTEPNKVSLLTHKPGFLLTLVIDIICFGFPL